ncbi:MAG: hypothetical protein JWR10_494 [Rubritepida sp.]|nr:hypothetical protein [Rubritepida sp.]
MKTYRKPNPPLARMILAASLLAAPALAQPGPASDANPAVENTAPARSPMSVPAIVAAPSVAPDAATAPAALPQGAALLVRPRVSQIIGSRVYNDRDENVGAVDDIVLAPPAAPSGQGPVAILQVGGFLGMGGRLIAVPVGDLRWNADRERITLPGASKEALQSRPAFDYGALRQP